MGKRKRVAGNASIDSQTTSVRIHNETVTSKKAKIASTEPVTIQIIVGTYERILHGITAAVVVDEEATDRGHDVAVEFVDTFLFNAHGSAIRCLALSPPTKQDKITLASGGSDQTINIYQLSARASLTGLDRGPSSPSIAGRKILEDPNNKEIGSLQQHAANVNALRFSTRSKLLSAADDNTIAVTRTRDWTILSTIKIPIPKAHGRPSGDTAPLGGTPAGVNDFAIHPSMKLMVSVSKGEKCMRLWNLVTGKKAGVLNFDKLLLQAVGEGRWGRGEGFRVEWNSLGEEFAVAFEKGAVIFGLVSAPSDLGLECINRLCQDSKPKGIVKLSPTTKIHQIHYIDRKNNDHLHSHILAVSTEDGRVVFFSTTLDDNEKAVSTSQNRQIPICTIIGEIGTDTEVSRSRAKDFEVLRVPGTGRMSASPLIVTASSEGSITLWTLDLRARLAQLALLSQTSKPQKGVNGGDGSPNASKVIPQVGRLLGRYETGNRITCLKAFIMAEAADHADASPHILDNAVDTNDGREVTSDDSSD